MYSWLAYSRLLRSADLKIEIENIEPLHVGSGKVGDPFSPVDLPVIRSTALDKGEPIPVIPGSSLKGVLRSSSEYLCRMTNVYVCNTGTQDECGKKLQSEISESLNAEEDAATNVLQKLCTVCKLYGTSSYSSRVIITNAVPVTQPKLEFRTGIAINRITGATKMRSLYEIESISAGCNFKFTSRFVNFTNYQLGLFAKSLRLVESGLMKIGGFKSRGHGLIKVKKAEFTCRLLKDHSYVMIKEGETIPPIDGSDVEISYKPTVSLRDISTAWDEYVSRKRS